VLSTGGFDGWLHFFYYQVPLLDPVFFFSCWSKCREVRSNLKTMKVKKIIHKATNCFTTSSKEWAEIKTGNPSTICLTEVSLAHLDILQILVAFQRLRRSSIFSNSLVNAESCCSSKLLVSVCSSKKIEMFKDHVI
jgi:hypothetical protein